MKYLFITIVFYCTYNKLTKIENLGNTKERKEWMIQEGVVGIGTTEVKEETIAGQKRIVYVKAKYMEQKAALKISIYEGGVVVLKAKQKIVLAKDKLAKDKRKNKISEQEYVGRSARLKMIEEKIKTLENNLIRSK
jgi:hypothetical protein